MRWTSLKPILWGLGALVVFLAVVVFWVTPASSRLDQETRGARADVSEMRSALPGLVGPGYADRLRTSLADGKASRQRLESELNAQTARMERWFPGSELVDDAPARDQFAGSYRFFQDELRRQLVGKAAARGVTLEEVPLTVPSFLAEERDPADVAEMRLAQRNANLESLLLKAVADQGAFPCRAMEFQAGWDAVSSGGPFRETTVTLHLSLPAAALHEALRALCELEKEGPVVRIEGLSTNPRPLPADLGPEDPGLIDADVRLVVSSFRRPS